MFALWVGFVVIVQCDSVVRFVGFIVALYDRYVINVGWCSVVYSVRSVCDYCRVVLCCLLCAIGL